MKELVNIALNRASHQGASYCDIRFVENREEWIQVRKGSLSQFDFIEDLGYGIRVLFDGAWGFASSNRITPDDLSKTTDRALSIARTFSKFQKMKIELVQEEPQVDSWGTPYIIHPFSVPLEEKLELLFKADEILRDHSQIAVSQANLHFRQQKKTFASTEGSYIVQDLLRSGGGMQVTALGEGDIQVRSYPMSFRGQFKGGGYEIILGLRLLDHAKEIRDEALALLKADPCPQKTTDIILGKGQMVLQIHESVGHANELDRVLGWEADFAGRSFNTIDHLGNFQYGSPGVNFIADSTAPTGLATFGYDDDGVVAKRFYVVKDGIFKNYFTTRDTASYIGQERSKGCSRAQGWQNMPITRIPNLSLAPGKLTLDELIATTDDGILMDYNRSWSIDQWRLNFQFGCEIGWEIKRGKITRMLKNPTYQGITPEFWKSCDGICNHDYWDLIGVVNCGKGQPMQIANMSHGSSPTRFRQIKVGM